MDTNHQEPGSQEPGNQGEPAPSGSNQAPDPLGRVVEALRTKTWLRRSLSFSSVVLLLVAVGMLGYPFFTNLWASRIQDRLGGEFASESLRADYEAALASGGRLGEGDALTRIQIPDIRVDTIVVEGITSGALRAGAGHYPDTPLPCQTGNVAIAGHRTTYGRPFHNLDRLREGSTIVLETPVGSCTYEVMGTPFIVDPIDVAVVAPPTGGDPASMLTLTTCHPKGSAKQRLVIQAQLVA